MSLLKVWFYVCLLILVGKRCSALTCDYFNDGPIKLRKDNPIQLSQDNPIENVAIGYGKHFEIEFDYEIHSLGEDKKWYNILHIGNKDTERLPAIFIFGGSPDFHIAIGDKSYWNNAFVVNHGTLNVVHHIHIARNRRQREVRIDGNVVYADKGDFTIDLQYNLYPIYLSNPWIAAADATLSNICVKSSFRQIAAKYAPILRFGADAQEYGYPMSAQLFYQQMNVDIENEPLSFFASPTYYHIQDCGSTLNIVYWWFYGNQKACIGITIPDIPFFPYSSMTFLEQGNHIGDWEHIVVEINKNDVNNFRVELNQHSGAYSLRSSSNDLQLYDNTHAIIYVGQIAHGSYHNTCNIGGCGYFHDKRGASDLLNTWTNLISLNEYPKEAWIAENNNNWVGMTKDVLRSSKKDKVCHFKACDETGCIWDECDTDALLIANPYCIGHEMINKILDTLQQEAIEAIQAGIDAVDDTISTVKDLTSELSSAVQEETKKALEQGTMEATTAILSGLMSVKDAVDLNFISPAEAVQSGLVSIENGITNQWISVQDAISQDLIDVYHAVTLQYLTIFDALSAQYVTVDDAIIKGYTSAYDAWSYGFLNGYDAFLSHYVNVFEAVGFGWMSAQHAIQNQWMTVVEAVNWDFIKVDDAVKQGLIKIEDAITEGLIPVQDAIDEGLISAQSAVDQGLATASEITGWIESFSFDNPFW